MEREDVEIAIKTILAVMADGLTKGQRIDVRGFGRFRLNYHPPRMGRTPQSGKSVAVPAKYVPHFRTGKELRERVARKYVEAHKSGGRFRSQSSLCAKA
jgi:integration host factor subunit beta